MSNLDPQAAARQSAAAYNAGDWKRAEQICVALIAAHPDHYESLHLLGIIRAQTGRAAAAEILLRSAANARPDDPVARNDLGNVLKDLGRLAESLACYDEALRIDPRYAQAWMNRGAVLRDLKRADDALASFDEALRWQPDDADACYSRGVIQQELGRPGDALASYDRALELDPTLSAAHYNRGTALRDLRKLDESVESYRAALRINPTFAQAHNNLGVALQELGRLDEALRSYEHAIELNPSLAAAHNNRGSALRALGRLVDALASYEAALRLNPAADWLYGTWLHTKLQLCDWSGLDAAVNGLIARTRSGLRAARPFTLLAVSDDVHLLRRASEIGASEHPATEPHPAFREPRDGTRRIRVAYYSSDLHNHATAYLAAELFELHDRSRFEVLGFSFGPDNRDAMRARLAVAFDRFIDVRTTSDQDIARLSRDLEVDIAVDLKGYTQDARPGIFAHRAAPVQVSYLGYPGTTGAACIDYLIADRVLIPPAARGGYSEKIIYLPVSYQINDRKRPQPADVPERISLGLPPSGFVYCCFNSSYKITPGVFGSWMRILRGVAGSVLWLLDDNPAATRNLRAHAQAHGIDPGRLVFAPRLPLAAHLSRCATADLVVDTLPCTAHTTASDALWAGVPLLTQLGESFAARVGASLLTAAGLPDLIAATTQQYEAVAIDLGTRPQGTQELRAYLTKQRLQLPLFDALRTTRHLESAYERIHALRCTATDARDIEVTDEGQ